MRDESSVSNDDVPVIPSQLKVTHQILSHWEPFRDLKSRFVDSRRTEQLSLHSQQRMVATVEDSVLRMEMAGLESLEEDDPKRILYYKPMGCLGQIRQPQDNRLPPPHTLIMDYTMTHIRFGCSHLHPMVQLTNTRRSDGAPDPDAALKEVTRIKIRHNRNLYLNRPDPIAFIPLAVDTTGRMYDAFIQLLFLHAHRETSVLDNELPEESDKFHVRRVNSSLLVCSLSSYRNSYIGFVCSSRFNDS